MKSVVEYINEGVKVSRDFEVGDIKFTTSVIKRERSLQPATFGKNRQEVMKYTIGISRDGKSAKFPFYDSVTHSGKMLTADDLKEISYIIFMEATSVMGGYDEFAQEFGYYTTGEDAKFGKKVFRAISNQKEKLNEMFTDKEITKIANELNKDGDF